MPQNDQIFINANIAISADTLQKIVQTGKSMAGTDEKGHYRIDTADLVSGLISQFLKDQDFDAYITVPRHYETVLTGIERS